ncbi:SHOCT domain-containing protein [Fusibacter ferrireducens]|uniref:SHOCT domain-containing protein n=1 Tax=Fusibacter ferrireducens TaxID=2785058 RepID=A0ABR9ZRL7_9FIRM|nr:SHOCT domain-containing protein [Fusibacter ferrireducens]MBF4692626.1 SHOCT domain-containing protein [Fusibacter ferrireducens]
MMFNRGFIGHSGCFGFGYFGMWQWLIVIGVILVIAYFISKGKGHRKSDAAIMILKEKFAKGEITEEEYTRRKELLERK